MRRTNKIITVIIPSIICFVLGFLFGSGYIDTRSQVNLIYSAALQSNEDISTIKKQHIIESFSYGHNSTHLWSLRLADDNYFRLTRLLPCRNVSYTGGLRNYGLEPCTMDGCDQSSANEFSLPNILQAQKWLYDHQHPSNCSNKRFAIIHSFAPSGFGSIIHQIAWAFGMALADNRIAVYETPGNWVYSDCSSGTPDCFFLPITNCSAPSNVDGNQIIRVRADFGHWSNPIHPPIFQNRTFNWYRAQLIFYLMRFKPQLLTHVQNTVANNFNPPSVDLHHPYITVYVRQSDKVRNKEMSQAYALKEYFDLFDDDARRLNITTVFINSEDEQVFNEFEQLNKEKQGYYKLLSVKAAKTGVLQTLMRKSKGRRRKVALEFLIDLFIEVNADLHVGTLTSNWCRLVDEIRLVLGKTLPYYTPENEFLMDL